MVRLLLMCLVLGGCAAGETAPILAMPSDAMRRSLLADLMVQPAVQMQTGTTGVVVVEYDVAADGRVQPGIVTYASPKGMFEKRARHDLSQWSIRPVPSRREGRRVRLEYRADGDGDVVLRSLAPAAGDCDALGFVIDTRPDQKWAMVSCSYTMQGRLDKRAATGWRWTAERTPTVLPR